MITSREITGHLREARDRGLNLYWKPRYDVGHNYVHGIRIIRARTRKSAVEVLSLGTGIWYRVNNGDAFYIQ